MFFSSCLSLIEEKAFSAFLRALFREDWVVYAKSQARYSGEVRHRDARSPEAVPRSRSTTRRPAPGRGWCKMSSGRPTGAIA